MIGRRLPLAIFHKLGDMAYEVNDRSPAVRPEREMTAHPSLASGLASSQTSILQANHYQRGQRGH